MVVFSPSSRRGVIQSKAWQELYRPDFRPSQSLHSKFTTSARLWSAPDDTTPNTKELSLRFGESRLGRDCIVTGGTFNMLQIRPVSE